MFLVVLLLMAALAGAAVHLPMPALLALTALVAGWLLAFGARERLSRRS
ncbi:hypothetical protein ACGFX4_12680 [Kitasatospora sp. NPDC048365]